MSSNTIAIAFGKISVDAIMDIISKNMIATNVEIFNSTDELSRAIFKNDDGKYRTVWNFGNGGSDYIEIFAGDRTLIHMGANEESAAALLSVLKTTGGFLLKNDCNDSEHWQQVHPTDIHTLSPNARLAIEIADIVGPKAVEVLRPLFDNQEKLALLGNAITRRLTAG